MNDARSLSFEHDIFAAELALRLLSEAELHEARARESSDPAFALAVEDWGLRLMPWLDAIAPVDPHPDVWTRIVGAIDPAANPAANPTASVVPIRRKLLGWRDAGFATAGLAAALLLGVGLRNPKTVAPLPAARASDLSVAAVVPEGGTTALAVVSYDRVGASLIVTPAGLVAAPGRAYELWVVPATGAPKSLGVLDGAAPRRIVLADDLAAYFAGSPGIAISSEQPGGSRTGAPVGPIVASGKLRRV